MLRIFWQLAYERHKHCVFISHTYQPHPLLAIWFLFRCTTSHDMQAKVVSRLMHVNAAAAL